MAKEQKQRVKNARKKKSAPNRVRAKVDSFTFPPAEHKQLKEVKKDCLNESVHVTKSEIIRVGLKMVRDLPTSEFLKRWKRLPKLSPGRPRKTANKK
jgi:hypothetical protein